MSRFWEIQSGRRKIPISIMTRTASTSAATLREGKKKKRNSSLQLKHANFFSEPNTEELAKLVMFFYSEKAEPTAVKRKMEPIGKRKTQPQLKIPRKKNHNHDHNK